MRFLVRERFETLRQFGIAAELFLGWVNRVPNPHSVDCVLLTYLTRGQGKHVMGDEAHDDRQGCLSVTHYDQVHDLLSSPEGIDVINLYLDPARFALPAVPESLRPALRAVIPIHPNLYRQFNRRVRVQMDDPEGLTRLLLALAAETTSSQPGQRQAMEALLQAVLITICRQVQHTGVVETPLHEVEPVEIVRQRLDEQYALEHSVSSLARLARMTPTSLCRAFKRATGRTLVEYLIQRRIEAVAHGLRSGHEKVLSLALDAGFSDLGHFNRQFRRLMGCTPREYRARWQG